jgi:hypothetical protein
LLSGWMLRIAARSLGETARLCLIAAVDLQLASTARAVAYRPLASY